MNSKTRSDLMWEWSLRTAGVIGLFWFIWYIITGEMPVVNEVVILGMGEPAPDFTLTLPFDMPRWTDIFVGPFLSISFIWFFSSFFIKKMEEERRSAKILPPISFCLCAMPQFAICIGMLGWLYDGLAGALLYAIAGILLLWAGIVLVYGLGYGLVYGLYYLYYGPIYGFKKLKPALSWLSRWLTAADKEDTE